MMSVRNRIARRQRRPIKAEVVSDPSARFAYDLATRPPTKDVASVKAASDIFEAGLRATGPRRDSDRSTGSVSPADED